jgi:hypothetical protein
VQSLSWRLAGPVVGSRECLSGMVVLARWFSKTFSGTIERYSTVQQLDPRSGKRSLCSVITVEGVHSNEYSIPVLLSVIGMYAIPTFRCAMRCLRRSLFSNLKGKRGRQSIDCGSLRHATTYSNAIVGAIVAVGDTSCSVLWGTFGGGEGRGLVRWQDVASTLKTTQLHVIYLCPDMYKIGSY